MPMHFLINLPAMASLHGWMLCKNSSMGAGGCSSSASSRCAHLNARVRMCDNFPSRKSEPKVRASTGRLGPEILGLGPRTAAMTSPESPRYLSVMTLATHRSSMVIGFKNRRYDEAFAIDFSFNRCSIHGNISRPGTTRQRRKLPFAHPQMLWGTQLALKSSGRLLFCVMIADSKFGSEPLKLKSESLWCCLLCRRIPVKQTTEIQSLAT